MKNLSLIAAIFVIAGGLFTATAFAEKPGDAAKGKEIYGQYCAACHGAEGKGDGVAAQALDPKPRDLSDAAFTSTITNDHMYKVIAEGGPAVGLSPLMAAWGGIISEQEIWDVIAFIRQDVCKCEYEKK